MAEERQRHQKYRFVKKKVRKDRLLYNIIYYSITYAYE